jgi:hypothetical protein
MAGTGTEQTRFRSGKQGGVSKCDAECDAISADRIELLARAVVLVAGMNIPEAAREAVLARVVAGLTQGAAQSEHSPGTRREGPGGHVGASPVRSVSLEVGPPDPRIGAAPSLVVARAVELHGIDSRRLGQPIE